MYSILLVEDDTRIASLLCGHLQKYGYHVQIAEKLNQIKEEFTAMKPDLVLLDINLPYFDGFYWCRQIRTISNVPIIFISARTDELNQVMAIEHGGDDYITKPFHLEVVLAKIKSVMRRTYGEYSPSISQESKVVEIGELYIYPDKYEAEWKNNRMSFSQKEFQLLSIFVKEHKKIVTRDELLEALWDEIDFVDDNTLTVNVNRLRKKLENAGLQEAITTIRGKGYKFEINRKDEQEC
ncbi:response regulator transcription factor [Bacillus atrophaeus]|uniref:response regulator transcription factor n=1 Tax=Bacillus atrophaeus TaxID=1452 RepID=UPI00077B1307|nr:response regulator transcription factor [Bacillus atrophaeus]KXZ19596.1 two-component system response regulator [Bacillus atrophaeus]MCY8835990.1 response regulator transcription factor [Bacillus atrophaeus]MCY9163556.1 response regulator transcription factor [Bacillus atrophaeus]MEC1901763.1 response regulator transcription factor [Bacillus atrophaeus]MEC2398250.1 response regulator transcription factor [Bacillus atrophaeus]